MPAMLDAALRYAALGWAIFPIEPKGKAPLGRLVPHGFQDASADEAKVRAWWGAAPDANIGLACGEASGVDVLDLDVPHDGETADGLATLSRYEAVHGQIRTLTSITGRGGMHLFFKHRPGAKNRVKTLPGCDVRTTGGYVVLPPSVHETGNVYAFAFGVVPGPASAQEWPGWLFELLFPAKVENDAAPAPYVAPPPEVASGYGRGALVKIHAEVAALSKGSRDDKRNAITFSAGRLVAAGLVTMQDAEEAVYGGCVVNGLVEDEGEVAIRKRIKAGLAAGIKKGPRGPAPRPPSATSRGSPKSERAPIAPSVQADTAILLPGAHTTDQGEYIEVGTDDFTAAVLGQLPPGSLYRMDREVGAIVGEPGERRFQTLDETAMRILVDSKVRLGRWVTVKAKNGQPEHQAVVFLSCHKDAAALILSAAANHPSVRQLQQIVSYPVYLPGLVRAKPGWNDAGGVFYDEPGPLKGITPTRDDPIAALADLTVDFPFQDEASRHNVYAGMLTLIMRPAIEGPVPFFLAMASLERTGKGKLIDTTFGVAVTGATVPPMQVGREEAETEKRITAQVLRGTSLIHLDNVPIGEALDSASLASLATAWPRWSGRLLGSSTVVEVPNRMVVTMSANNPRATGELVKRTVPIVLAPKNDHPELREDFVHPDAIGYAAQQRPKILAALLGMVENWKDAKKPISPLRMGGFERWAACIVSILRFNGAAQVMENYRKWCKAANDENADIEALIEAWAAKHGHDPIPPGKVLDIVEATGTFLSVLAKPSRQAQLASLGKVVLTPLIDRPVKQWVVRFAASGNNRMYRLDGGLFE
jgi:hypothetical protein